MFKRNNGVDYTCEERATTKTETNNYWELASQINYIKRTIESQKHEEGVFYLGYQPTLKNRFTDIEEKLDLIAKHLGLEFSDEKSNFKLEKPVEEKKN